MKLKSVPINDLLQGVASIKSTARVTSVSTNSKAVSDGGIFVAVKGTRVDGHDYAAAALDAGAICVIAEKEIAGVDAEKVVVTPNTLDALVKISGNYRDKFSPFVVGITGSVGKTTTKEFCGAIFARFGNTLKTEGNQNNEIGVPRTLFELHDETNYAVIEMGMDSAGDISKLTKVVKPKIAIITKIGTSHIANLGSRENIFKAKMEICEGISEGGTLVVNGDDDMLSKAIVPRGINKATFGIDARFAQVLAIDIVSTAEGEKFTISDKMNGDFEAFIPTVGKHNIYNALAAYTAATRQGLPPQLVADALSDYKTTGMRQRLTEKSGRLIIEDCYNANPDSMRAGIEALGSIAKGRNGNKIAVLGDMLELGEVSTAAHQEAGRLTARAGVETLIVYGEYKDIIAEGAKKAGIKKIFCCETKSEIAKILFETTGEGDTILFKASRGVALEDAFLEFYKLID